MDKDLYTWQSVDKFSQYFPCILGIGSHNER